MGNLTDFNFYYSQGSQSLLVDLKVYSATLIFYTYC